MNARLPRAMCQIITVVRRGVSPGKDDYGNPLPAPDVTHDIGQCSLQPLQGVASTENMTVDFDQIATRWRLFTPPGADIVDNDRVKQGDLDLQVDGRVMSWPGPDGSPHHREGYCKVWGG